MGWLLIVFASLAAILIGIAEAQRRQERQSADAERMR